MTTLHDMFVEPTAHHLCDSGSIYGRSYQTNQKRDFASEPQATLSTKYGYPEVSVNTVQHLEACLEEDVLCRAFNALENNAWDGERSWGISAEHDEFLDAIGADIEEPWNSYNWDNCFDQVVQARRVYINGEEYVLMQIHGGCDVRSGYTDAKLFKIIEPDYFMDDCCSFDIPRPIAEAAGYPVQPCDYDDSDYIIIDVRGSDVEVYDPRTSDTVEVPEGFWEALPELKLEGVQRAIEH